MVRYLTGEGRADVKQKLKGINILGHALGKGCTEVVRYLVEEVGVDVNQSTQLLIDETDRTPLCIAAELGHIEVVRYLVGEGGVDVNKASDGGTTPPR